jgi:hypothetical protein
MPADGGARNGNWRLVCPALGNAARHDRGSDAVPRAFFDRPRVWDEGATEAGPIGAKPKIPDRVPDLILQMTLA